MDGMAHFFTIALDHRLQFFYFFWCDLSLDKAIQAISNRQHAENKIDIAVHNPTIVIQMFTANSLYPWYPKAALNRFLI